MTKQVPTPITQLRPRFKIVTDTSGQEIAYDLTQALKAGSSKCIGVAHPKYALLKIPVQNQHYWSPQLSISIEEAEEGTVLRGTYGPRPSVWTMFVFFYTAIGFAVFILTIIGLALISMDESVAFMWSIPVLVILFFSLYHVAYIGKQKGYEQGETLHHFFEEATGLSY